jgi:hypothetical protein
MIFNKKLFISTLSALIFLSSIYHASAQGNLNKLVDIGPEKKISIGSLLQKITDKQQYSFAYNNSTIPADSLIEMPAYRGSVFNLLEKLLGDNYEFREVPGYIVLRSAHGRLVINAEIESWPGNQKLIKGFVVNASDHRALPGVSIFEELLLVSALTDEQGHFQMVIKNWDGSINITARKENFRDTSLHLLSDVLVTGKPIVRKYKYFASRGSRSVERNRFARFFIGSKQLIQSMNIGNFFASRPYQISVVPGLSSHGLYNSQIIDHFSLNMFGGYTAGIDGFEAGGFFNINRGDVRYFQAAGIFNLVGGNVSGVQLAGIYNQVFGTVSGFQVAGIINKAAHFSQGVQLAGFGNIAQNRSSFQISGLFNYGGDQTSVQFASFLNIAHAVHRTQIGLVNIADSSDYPVGLINWIKTGEKTLSLESDETGAAQLNLRSGGRVLYGVIGAGYKLNTDDRKYLVNFGIGAHIIHRSRFNLDAELVSSIFTNFDKADYQRSSLKVVPELRIKKHLGIFAGPSLNSYTSENTRVIPVNGWLLKRDSQENGGFVSIGVFGGLHYVW